MIDHCREQTLMRFINKYHVIDTFVTPNWLAMFECWKSK